MNGLASEVQGHRGARWSRAENTMPAFQFAVEAGVDTLELDMHVTKDDQIVLIHDHFLNPDLCLDASGNKIKSGILVRSLTLQQLQSYDCGSLRNPKFKEQKPVGKTHIPTLDELFSWIEKSAMTGARKVKFNIETKSEESHPEYTPAPKPFVELFLAVVKKHKMLARVTLQSFDYRTLKVAHELEPKLSLSLLIEDAPKSQQELVTLMKIYHAEVLSPQSSWLTQAQVEAMHEIGVRVIPWTVNTAEEWEKMLSLRVDGIITDNPKGLIEFLKAKRD